MAKRMKKKERNMLMTIGLAASAAYFIKTFPLGDTIIGGAIGAAFGNPLAGALVGAVVPSRKEGGTFSLLADADPFGGLFPGAAPAGDGMAPNGAETA